MSANNGDYRSSKATLLKKYDMSIDCLTFEYIEKCNNVKEMEKIIKVLRSGEEGCYPHLEKSAEEKLLKLAPNSLLLRVEQPVIHTTALEPREQEQVSSDVQAWADEMIEREVQLKSVEPLLDDVPAIRNSTISKTVIDKNKVNKAINTKSKEKSEKPAKKCVPNDYTFWDKFDAESEVIKMDLEEERIADQKAKELRQREEMKKIKSKLEEESEKVALKDAAIGAGDGKSLAEREFKASLERTKGNDCYRSGDYSKALHYYTNSITLLPTIDAHNNRAQAYIKLQHYAAAVGDCNQVLSMDPLNVKGYHRRGVASLHLNDFSSALNDFEKALEMDPNNKDSQEFAKRARLKLGIPASSKRVRMAIHDTDSATSVKVEEVNKEKNDIYYPFFNTSPNDDIVLNEIGTAKVMCRCSGTPGFMQKVRSLEDIKEHGRLCLRRTSSSQSKKQEESTGTSKLIELTSNRCLDSTQPPRSSNSNNERPESQRQDIVGKSIPKIDKKFAKETPQDSKSGVITETFNKDAAIDLENLKTPYAFSVFWNSIKGIEDIATVAKALNVLSPEKISQVVGNKLDENMLSLFILALRTHYSLPSDWGVVQRYLQSFTQLPRFGIANMMLEKSAKKELESLLNDAEAQGLRVSDLLQHYGLTNFS